MSKTFLMKLVEYLFTGGEPAVKASLRGCSAGECWDAARLFQRLAELCSDIQKEKELKKQ